MNKKILLSAAVAVMLVAALAVTAFAVGVSGPSSVDTGDTITITVSGSGEGTSGKISTSGLDITSVSGGMSTASDLLLLSEYGGMTATYTCTVTAGAGETASFSVSDVTVSDGTSDSPGEGGSWSATVAGASEPSDEPSSEPSDEPSQNPSSEPSGDASASASASGSAAPGGQTTHKPGTSGSVKPGTSGKTDNMPKTGDATMDLWTLAVIAAACATVAVVAGKKVFSHK